MLNSTISHILILCLILSISLPGLSISASNKNTDDGLDFAHASRIGIASFGVVYTMFALSPYKKYKQEIRTLQEDQIFIRRHLSIMADSPTRDSMLSRMEVMRSKQHGTELKFKKFRRWFYPLTAVVGVGMLYLADDVFSD